MIAVHMDHISVTYTTEPVFSDLSWQIHDDRRVGLIGPNGCGKSTLLHLIAAELSPDEGTINRKKDLSIGYLHQEPQLAPQHTVWQEALSASEDMARIEAALTQGESQLADPAVYGDEKTLARVLERQEKLLEQYNELGGPGYEGRVRSTLRSLGFDESDLDLPIWVLSGGQKKLVGLAKLLITQPDLLLLDEPDNHLDLAGKIFLEQIIREYQGAVIIVSHDRYLLDQVVEEIVELEDGRLSHYAGTYSEYTIEKELRLLRQQQLYAAQQKEITRIETAIARFEHWARIVVNERHARQARSRKKMLERMDKIEKPTLERKRMRLELTGWRGSNKVLEIVDLDKVFPPDVAREEQIILAGLDLLIWHGERVGLVGPNGAGKSLLFRLILGQEQPSGGRITIGPSVRTGYYAQQHETLDYESTLIDTVRQAAALSEPDAVAFLGRFLFGYEQSREKVGHLSGGERSRLQLALLMLSGANFLLLDEPTNNLDIASAEVLEQVLDEFVGSALIISHDRYFLDRVVDRIVELDEGTLVEYVGGYSDYQEAKVG